MKLTLEFSLPRPRRGFAAASMIMGAACFSGCATTGPSGATSAAHQAPAVPAGASADRIAWPAEYEPRNATFFVRNEIEIKAPPRVVWDILIHAEDWPAWYAGATEVSLKNSPTGRLAAGSVLAWNTMGLRFESRIREFAPPVRLSWESRKATITGYHAWLIIPTPGGCKVITEESQRGFLAVMQKIFIPQKLRRLHDVWLEELKKKAEARATGS